MSESGGEAERGEERTKGVEGVRKSEWQRGREGVDCVGWVRVCLG